MWSVYTSHIRTDHEQNFNTNTKAGTSYFNPLHTANGIFLSTPTPQECYDYVQVLSLEKFLSLDSLESFEQGKLPYTSNCEKIYDNSDEY